MTEHQIAILQAVTEAAERGGWEGAQPAIRAARAEIARLSTNHAVLRDIVSVPRIGLVRRIK